jgi:hypothetical protein
MPLSLHTFSFFLESDVIVKGGGWGLQAASSSQLLPFHSQGYLHVHSLHFGIIIELGGDQVKERDREIERQSTETEKVTKGEALHLDVPVARQ